MTSPTRAATGPTRRRAPASSTLTSPTVSSGSAGERVEIAIVGAGLAGLIAARRLAAAGRRVVLLDKGEAPGGRMATRRIGAAALDQGAQFFTIRKPAFSHVVDGWRADGLKVHVWADGFAQAASIIDGPAGAMEWSDGHHRYVVEGGMHAVARHLARGLSLRSSTAVLRLRGDDRGWRVDVRGGPPLHADAVVLTPPVPEALRLLDAGVELPQAVHDLRFWSCLTLLALLDRPAALPAPGGVQFATGPVSWLGDNLAKGLSPTPALTVHAAGGWSDQQWDAPDPDIIADLVDYLHPWLGGARVEEAQLQRWRYSAPLTTYPDHALLIEKPAPLVLAGDAFAGAKIEGAALSGLAAAEELLG